MQLAWRRSKQRKVMCDVLPFPRDQRGIKQRHMGAISAVPQSRVFHPIWCADRARLLGVLQRTFLKPRSVFPLGSNPGFDSRSLRAHNLATPHR